MTHTFAATSRVASVGIVTGIGLATSSTVQKSTVRAGKALLHSVAHLGTHCSVVGPQLSLSRRFHSMIRGLTARGGSQSVAEISMESCCSGR